MKVLPVLFEKHEIRRLYDEKTETWYFSVVDIVQVLTPEGSEEPTEQGRQSVGYRL